MRKSTRKRNPVLKWDPDDGLTRGRASPATRNRAQKCQETSAAVGTASRVWRRDSHSPQKLQQAGEPEKPSCPPWHGVLPAMPSGENTQQPTSLPTEMTLLTCGAPWGKGPCVEATVTGRVGGEGSPAGWAEAMADGRGVKPAAARVAASREQHCPMNQAVPLAMRRCVLPPASGVV